MKKRKNLYLKVLGIFFVLIIIFSSVRVTFADQDIASMLSNWLNNKSTQSINEIEKDISMEQANQTARLKREIQQAIHSADQQYQDFVENEKVTRTNRIVDYADKLIENYDVTVDSQEDVIQMLDCIAINAEIQMDIVLGLKDKNALKDCGNLTSKLKDTKSVDKSTNEDIENDVDSEFGTKASENLSNEKEEVSTVDSEG
jgi:hypothetical protein